MITKIGIAAGEIWHMLDKSDRLSVDDIVKDADAPRDTVLMSIGWLAREGHIVLEGEMPNQTVSLRPK